MKEFVDKLICELEEQKGDENDYTNAEGKKLVRHWNNCVDICKEIVNQLAEEYKQCTLCYLQSPCEYQNVNILLEHYDSEVSDCYLSSDGNCSFINNKGKCECVEAQILECLKELEQYRAIGTIEEFKAWKEDIKTTGE